MTSRMTPIVQRIGTLATNPMTSRMIPRIILRHLVSGRTDPEDRLPVGAKKQSGEGGSGYF